MRRTALRSTSLALIVAMVGQLLAPCLALADERDFNTVLSGLPILPEKANEPFPPDMRVEGMPLGIFLDTMAKPEMLDLSFLPMVPDSTLKKKLGLRIRNVTKGEAFGLVLQLNDLKAIQFNERTVIIVPVKDPPRDFGLKTRKIYRLTYTTPKKIKDFVLANKSLAAIINKESLIPNDDGQSILAIDTEKNIALIDSIVALLDQKPNKIEAKIPLSFLNGTEFTTAVNNLGPDVQQRVNTKAMFYSEKGRSLIVYDTPDNVEFIRALVRKVDLPARQVLIDTAIMQVNSTFTRQMGVRMRSSGFYVDSLDRLFNQQRLNAWLRGGSGSTNGNTSNANTSTGSNTNGAGVQLTSAADIIYAIQRNGGQTLANPKIRTLDNERASITIGNIIVVRITSTNNQQSPTGQSQSTVNTTPQEVTTGVQLAVKPTIHHDKTVTLELTVSNDKPTAIKDYGVDRSTTNSTSKLRVKDAETVILGGFIDKTDSRDTTPVPLLGEIPILRSIFNANKTEKLATELVLLITPYILEYFTNPNTGEAELPRISAKADEEDKDRERENEREREVELQVSADKAAKKEHFALRSPSGQPLVRNIYDSKGHVLLRHQASQTAQAATAAQQQAAPAGDLTAAAAPRPPAQAAPGAPWTPPPGAVSLAGIQGTSRSGGLIDPSGEGTSEMVVDRSNPVATFRPAALSKGTADARVAAPAIGTGGDATLERYESAVEQTSAWQKRGGESRGRIAFGNEPPGTSGGPAEFTNRAPASTPAAPDAQAQKSVLESFGRVVHDTSEWKDGVVRARREDQPQKIQEYGVVGRLGEKVAEAQQWSKEVTGLKNARTASPAPAAPASQGSAASTAGPTAQPGSGGPSAGAGREPSDSSAAVSPGVAPAAASGPTKPVMTVGDGDLAVVATSAPPGNGQGVRWAAGRHPAASGAPSSTVASRAEAPLAQRLKAATASLEKSGSWEPGYPDVKPPAEKPAVKPAVQNPRVVALARPDPVDSDADDPGPASLREQGRQGTRGQMSEAKSPRSQDVRVPQGAKQPVAEPRGDGPLFPARGARSVSRADRRRAVTGAAYRAVAQPEAPASPPAPALAPAPVVAPAAEVAEARPAGPDDPPAPGARAPANPGRGDMARRLRSITERLRRSPDTQEADVSDADTPAATRSPDVTKERIQKLLANARRAGVKARAAEEPAEGRTEAGSGSAAGEETPAPRANESRIRRAGRTGDDTESGTRGIVGTAIAATVERPQPRRAREEATADRDGDDAAALAPEPAVTPRRRPRVPPVDTAAQERLSKALDRVARAHREVPAAEPPKADPEPDDTEAPVPLAPTRPPVVVAPRKPVPVQRVDQRTGDNFESLVDDLGKKLGVDGI